MLESDERQNGIAREPLRLARAPLPAAFDRPMRIWTELHRNRQTGGMGLCSLTWPDFHAYGQVTGDVLDRDDIEAIRIIEDEFHASRAAAEERRNKAAAKAEPRKGK